MVQTTVEKHTAILEYDLTVGLSAMEGRGFYYPTDTAIAPNGRLYVPNRSVDGAARGVRVTVCDITASTTARSATSATIRASSCGHPR